MTDQERLRLYFALCDWHDILRKRHGHLRWGTVHSHRFDLGRPVTNAERTKLHLALYDWRGILRKRYGILSWVTADSHFNLTWRGPC